MRDQVKPFAPPTRDETVSASDALRPTRYRDTAFGAEALTAIAPALALAACGGGDSDQGGGTTPPVVQLPVPTLTTAQASRLLGQATMGATREEIGRVQNRGIEGWLSDQFAMPRATTLWDWMVSAGYSAPAYVNDLGPFDVAVWRQLVSARDQLRQRVGMALFEILVVGVPGLAGGWRAFGGAAYLDLLMDGAFGNFRTLLEQISTNAAMAQYLTFLGNRKANPTTGSVPDENYARELLQLFTIGVHRLNPDGSVQGGASPVESYNQSDVTGLARVFTGFEYDSGDASTPARLRRPLIVNAAQHEPGAKSFLGTATSGSDGMADLRAALDAIFAHPNVAPFISKQLIQRLVTSNPSPGYVQRVGAVFANNGSNVRGDLRAVVHAILVDGEARDDTGITQPNFGKLREPIMRMTGWARAFGATSPSDTWPIGDTSDPRIRLGQSPGRSPSVFNFFRPGYTPPNTAIAAQSLVAPELQITNELSVVGYLNYMQALIANGVGDFRANYAEVQTRAGDGQALVDEINVLLAAGQLSAATVATIRSAVESISATAAGASLARVQIAILLTMAAPEFLVQK